MIVIRYIAIQVRQHDVTTVLISGSKTHIWKLSGRNHMLKLVDVRFSQVQFLLVLLAKTRACSKNILGASVLLKKKTNYRYIFHILRVCFEERTTTVK